jgi:hypothetical protein
MAQKQIKQFTEETAPAAGDVYLMQKASNDETVKVDAENIIADGTVMPAKLVTGAGTTWVWQTFGPNFGNLSGGTLNYAKYSQIGKTVRFRFKYTLGGAGVSGPVTITPPVTLNTDYADGGFQPLLSTVLYRDSDVSANRLQGVIVISGSNTFSLSVWDLTSTIYMGRKTLSSTVPFTWASGDIIYAEGSYEAA